MTSGLCSERVIYKEEGMARDLKTIALELLKKYEEDERDLIYEFSGEADTEVGALKLEVEKYREEIEEASK